MGPFLGVNAACIGLLCVDLASEFHHCRTLLTMLGLSWPSVPSNHQWGRAALWQSVGPTAAVGTAVVALPLLPHFLCPAITGGPLAELVTHQMLGTQKVQCLLAIVRIALIHSSS